MWITRNGRLGARCLCDVSASVGWSPRPPWAPRGVARERPAVAGLSNGGASRARTDDLLGAICARSFAIVFHESSLGLVARRSEKLASPPFAALCHLYLA